MFSGISPVPPVPAFSPTPAARAESKAGNGAGDTTLAVEKGSPAAVVYQPGAAQGGQSLTYSVSDKERRRVQAEAAASNVPGSRKDRLDAYYAEQRQKLAGASHSESAKLVEATGGIILPPPQMPRTPHAAQIKAMSENVWTPVRPVMTELPEGWAKSTPIATRPASKR